jgi:large subunit ribosomal protein L16
MLSPKRTKFRKSFKYKPKNIVVQNELYFGLYALKALETGSITSRQIEAARRAITRKLKREGRVWINIYPHIPVTSKPTEVRMGKGKGSPQYWMTRVKSGQLVFELALPMDNKGNVNESLSREVLRFGAGKLSFPTLLTTLKR